MERSNNLNQNALQILKNVKSTAFVNPISKCKFLKRRRRRKKIQYWIKEHSWVEKMTTMLWMCAYNWGRTKSLQFHWLVSVSHKGMWDSLDKFEGKGKDKLWLFSKVELLIFSSPSFSISMLLSTKFYGIIFVFSVATLLKDKLATGGHTFLQLNLLELKPWFWKSEIICSFAF